MSQTWATINLATDGGDDVFQTLDDRSTTLRTCWSGATAPGTPSTGQLWFDSTNLILYYYDGAGWVEVGTVISSNPDFQLVELLNARMDNTASNPTPAAGNVGLVVLHTGAGKLKVVATASVLETIVSISNADYQSVPLPLRSWSKDDTNPPSDLDIGTSPIWRCWLFDAVAERMHTQLRLPAGYSADASCLLRVHYILPNAETASDTLDSVVDYKKCSRDSTDAADGTSTQKTGSTSVGANAGQYTYHVADIVLLFNDASNPLTAKDALALSWGLNAISSVVAAAVFDAELLCPCGTKLTEA